MVLKKSASGKITGKERHDAINLPKSSSLIDTNENVSNTLQEDDSRARCSEKLDKKVSVMK